MLGRGNRLRRSSDRAGVIERRRRWLAAIGVSIGSSVTGRIPGSIPKFLCTSSKFHQSSHRSRATPTRQRLPVQ